jgi:outer membrane protein TolC
MQIKPPVTSVRPTNVRHTLVCRSWGDSPAQSEHVSSTRSVSMNLARPFKAGKKVTKHSRRVATPESSLNRRYATREVNEMFQALKRRAKFILTLRVEDICSKLPEMLRTAGPGNTAPRIATLALAVVILALLAPGDSGTSHAQQPSQQQQQPAPSATPAQQPTRQTPGSQNPTAQPSPAGTQPGTNPQNQPPLPGEQQPPSVAPVVQPPSPSTQSPQTTPPATAPPGVQPPANPSGTQPANNGQQTPGQNIGVSAGVAPAELPTDPPPVAPNFEAPARPLPSAERVGVDVTNQTPITLNEAIALALQNNNDIDSSRIDVKIAEFNLTAARGAYDPLLSNESFFESRTTPTSSTISGGVNGFVTQKDLTNTASLNGFSPIGGGSYRLDFSGTRLQTSNQNAQLNPQFPSSLIASYTQPLWRGLRFDNNRRQIEIAKKNLSLTDAQFRQRAIDVISQVQQAYWDLVFSLRNLQVQIDAVKQARLQVESNQRLVAQGVLAPIDIVAAGTQVTTFEQNVYTAQESVTRAENTLKTLILPNRAASLWPKPLTPITPVSLEPPRVPLELAVNNAMKSRPELSQLQTSAEINRIDTRYYRELTKPQIDLVGTYTSAGLAGTPTTRTSSTPSTTTLLVERVNLLSTPAGLPLLEIPVATGSTVPPNLVGGLNQSLTNLFQRDYPTYNVAVRFSLPLRNRTAEANLGSSLAVGNRIMNQRAQTEQIIEAEVRNASQSLRSAEARLAAAAASRSSSELQYESEQRQFNAGTSTTFLVLQRQTELLAARGRELQAQTDLNKAIADFQRAVGNTLEANHFSVRSDSPNRPLELARGAGLWGGGLTSPEPKPTADLTTGPEK